MAASYPGSVKTFTLKVDGAGNIIFAAHVNDLQDEVNAVEGGLLNGLAHVLRPDATASNRDLGTSSARWRALYLNGELRWNNGANFDQILQSALGSIRVDINSVGVFIISAGALTPVGDGGSSLGTGALRWGDIYASSTFRIGTNVASTGAVRLANAAWIAARNALNGGDVNMVRVDATDLIAFGANLNAPTLAGGLATADPSAALGLATKQYVDATAFLVSDVTSNEISTSTTETTLATLSVPGGTLSTNKFVVIEVMGDFLNNTGADRGTTLRVKYGGTTIASLNFTPIATNAARRPWQIRIVLSAANATGAQVAAGHGWVGTVDVTGGGGTPVGTAISGAMLVAGHMSVAVDSTTAQNVEVSAQNSAADATLATRVQVVHVTR